MLTDHELAEKLGQYMRFANPGKPSEACEACASAQWADCPARFSWNAVRDLVRGAFEADAGSPAQDSSSG